MSALFATFDVFPLPKGSSTHIAHTLKALSALFGQVNLVTLGFGEMPRFQKEGDISIYRCLSHHPNFLKRTEYFYDFIHGTVDRIGDIDHVHFRDIWGGMALFDDPRLGQAKKIFEVNGLPSIELPYHYPQLMRNPGLLSRIRMMEDHCLEAADGIITVSNVTKRYLEGRGVPAAKIRVIPNTASEFEDPSPDGRLQPEDPMAAETGKIILYAGTLTEWQGLPTLIKAFELISDRDDVILFIAGSTYKYSRNIKKAVRKAGLEDKIKFRTGLSRESLHRVYRRAAFSMAPLSRCSRNELQGCSPLKIIESMSAGTPVIASNLAVCAEYIEHMVDGILVPPDSPRALASAMTMLLDDEELAMRLGRKARAKSRDMFCMELWMKRFHAAYEAFTREI
ncbi:MAG TPA: glycosyltransferase family 4 protein [Spirochaetota bacterium]|nr:glycosyltransferase family 4 protein [Spirochaetota bacterium]HQH97575.1 glycosyltransferase family 4 protein [Spirochaetota bacterium]